MTIRQIPYSRYDWTYSHEISNDRKMILNFSKKITSADSKFGLLDLLCNTKYF